MSSLLFYIIYGLLRILSFIPLRILYIFSDLTGLILYHVIGYRRRVVFENLRRSFPEKTPFEIKSIAKRFYRHLGDLIIETIYQTGIGRKEIARRVKYNNPELISRYFNEGKSVAAVMGHYGNWEWMFGFPMITSYRCVTIYRPLKNRLFDRLMLEMRSRFGADLVPMKLAVRKLYECREKGIPTITAFIADQSPPREKSWYWIDFLNQDTPVYNGVAQIARKMDLALVYFRMSKIRRGCYEFDFIPLFENCGSMTELEITRAHVSELEKHIRSKPEYWLWSHKRWKHKKEVGQ